MKTLIAFAWNGIGLGHVSRVVAVAEEYRRLDEQADVLLFVMRANDLLDEYELPHVVVPSYRRSLVGDDWRGPSGVSLRPRIAHRATGALVAAMLYGKDGVVLHDVVIHRALYEWADSRGVAQALVARARRDRPDPVAWVLEHARGIRHLLVPGARSEVAVDRGVSVIGVSPIGRRPLGEESVWSEGDRSSIRVAVLAGAGGWEGAETFFTVSLSALSSFAVSETTPVVATVVTGPYYRGRLVVPRETPLEVRVVRYLSATRSPFSGTDVAVCLGGFNTFVELTRAGVPGIVVPTLAGTDDADARARAYSQGWPGLRVAAADPDQILDGLRALRASETAPAPDPQPVTGAREAAAYLRALA